jgi:CRISPR-associated endonuclease Cas1
VGARTDETEETIMTPKNNQILTSIVPRHGVVTLFGYGIKVHVDRGHLILEDGIGPDRHQARLARVGHRLQRLVIVGSDGFVSLAALRWLADQDAAFVMLERDGRVLASTGPAPGSNDARLRRAQALALQSGAGLQIARELITKKLAGQEQVAREKLNNSEVANTIAHFQKSAVTAKTLEAILMLESQGAAEYWSAWDSMTITFPKADLRRVPDHWRAFKTRRSPLSGSQRVAADPLNAILNYLYAVLESEARLAVSAMGLDAGLGILHLDTKARDSLACDLMEPVRPNVDAFVLDWISGAALRRDWFFEQRDGNCRLMGSFAVQLSETASMWRRAVAPIAESVARTLWSTLRKPAREPAPATRLTQRRKREAKGSPAMPSQPAQLPQRICRVCGNPILPGRTLCASCGLASAADQLAKAGPSGRAAAHSAKAEARRADTQRRNAAARWSWDPSSQPAWLNEETYARRIQPLLAEISTSAISSALGVSWVYAKYIRLGQRRPHPRHWQTLARLVGVSAEG